jgi:glycosyltransferase involved in cell wall biosynthesis
MDSFRVDLVKYSRDRLPSFRMETAVLTTPHGRKVRKRALDPEGERHLQNLVDGRRLLEGKLSGANLPSCTKTDDGVLLDLIEGEYVEDVVLRLVSNGDREGVLAAFARFRAYLAALGTAPAGLPMNGVVKELLADADVGNEEMMPVANIDLTMDNVIMDASGRLWITDYEWVFDSPIPRSFLLYRSLYVLYLKHNGRLEGLLPFSEALSSVGVPEALWEPYRQACERFIDMVFGPERPHMVPVHYLKETHRLASMAHLQDRERRLTAVQVELEATRSALEEMIASAKLREERLQEQERCLGELSDRVERLRAAVAERDGMLESQRIELESERLSLSAATAQLQTERDHALELKEELRVECDIRAHLEKERQEMTERLMDKQAELMAMSDWARSMQLRLEFLESVPSVRLTEKLARTYKLAVDKLRSEGTLSTLKCAAIKMAPQKVRQMFHRQEPAYIEVLEADARGGDVLVVFPVIPWEFRWQRPQQLVSRFAANGHTVLFINMNLTPKGVRYVNDAEALKDISLGKLGEHIFELHLCSFNRLNVYQDRIKGVDLNNIAHGLLGILRQLNARSVTYLVQFPGWKQLAVLARSKVPGLLVFDCMDDHAGFVNNAADVIKQETKLMERADLVVTSSAKLYDKALMFNDNTLLVRNGTDFELFHALRPNGRLDGVRRPIIGYYGAISEWFDPGVVARCAEKHPEWTFVLIGSTLGCNVNGLRRLANVHLLGEMPYRDLPGYLYYFDVCMIPFKVCELTMATNPVKFYEYISSGKPVVSVRLPEMERHADICYLYNNDEEFEKGILSALAEKDEGLRTRRMEVARTSSWDQRFQDIKGRLEEMRNEEERGVRLLRWRHKGDETEEYPEH